MFLFLIIFLIFITQFSNRLKPFGHARVAYVRSMTCGRRSCIAGSRGQCQAVGRDFFVHRMFLIHWHRQRLVRRARQRTVNSVNKNEIIAAQNVLDFFCFQHDNKFCYIFISLNIVELTAQLYLHLECENQQ